MSVICHSTMGMKKLCVQNDVSAALMMTTATKKSDALLLDVEKKSL